MAKERTITARTLKQWFWTIFLSLAPAVVVAAQEAASPASVTVQMSWKYQFEFAPIIAAYEKGFYRDAGLAVAIREGGPGVDPVARVSSGQADFGIFSSALVVEYARGKPVVALAALMQHSAVAILARSRDGIHTAHDLAGKTVAVSKDTQDEIVAYLEMIGLGGDRVHIIDKSRFKLENLEDADAISAYVSNEGFYLQGHENDYLLFSPRSAGIDLFGNILFTSKTQLKKRRAVVEAFRAATLRGLEYSLNHRDELVELILARYNSQNKSREHLLYEAEKMAELTRPDIVEPGYMSVGRWRHVAEVYAGLGKMPRDFNLADFIYDPNPRVDLRWLYWLLAVTVTVLMVVSVVLWQLGRFNRRLKKEIQERQQAELLFRASEARSRDLFDKSPDPCWLLDGNRFVDCNEAAIRILGYPDKSSLMARHPAEVSPETQPDGRSSRAKADAMMALAQQRSVHRFEWLHQRLDGSSFPVEVTLARYNMEGRDALYCVWRDITERKRIDKMKDEFISTVSHEIRTPLTSIVGSLGLLAGGVAGELPEKARPLLEIAVNNAKRLLLLINDILDLSKIEAGALEYQMAPLELMPFIEEAVTANEHYGKRHKVEFVIQQRLEGAWLFADSNRLMQVMNNLLSNAAKFSRPDSKVEIGVARDAGRLVISVRDYGAGIPAEFHPRVFEKFSQADSSDARQMGGTGLGLNIARAIVLAHGGAINFTSVHGAGSEFRVSLPEYHVDTHQTQRA